MVSPISYATVLGSSYLIEAFALFDKKGTGQVPKESLGELLRSLGQNPTQAEVQGLERGLQGGGTFGYEEFLNVLNRPDGWKPAGTADEFIKGFQVFDKSGNGFIGAGELRYVLTQLGEKMSDEEVDELLKGFPVQ
ncbi:myosin regulatory light chain cdc4 [Kwoniella mangroviensis CBS 10435]|uniref:Myosin regulatory light chain cdc4 n=1 Tax=Kwoniella mangroviensis CBS 10435 TaxID=1331196 RepID=A0A1B9ISF3_9TREE|nr:myosin regulatory light chain cdc4 [Kwoniella mangroviensis CBS 8507]OCF58472.1 myosin regulatory light chain cdc4 [Kwoniella mangroviensis CBS 10435]OCF64126.1 myosin regulatory light chain cdc4 [Kwoniella mangroviensis CBS 8507]